MMNMIVAVDSKWGIGKDGHLLASLPTDMKWFKAHTTNDLVIMGRKTLESLPGGKPLKGRTNVVLTRDLQYERNDCIVCHDDFSVIPIIEFCEKPTWIIGGASVYKKYYKLCDRLYVTKMEKDLQADTFIDNIDEDDLFTPVFMSDLIVENGIPYRFWIYEKR